MADSGQLALIHAEIDGELDAAQRAELARALLADPQARKLRDDLRRVCQTLDGMPLVDPPPGLRESILAAMPHAAPVDIRNGTLRTPRGVWTQQWRYAAGIAAVAAAATMVLITVHGIRPALPEISGTLTTAPVSALIDSATVAGGSVTGRVGLYRDRSGLSLELSIRAPSPLDVRIAGEGHTLRINGLGREESGAAPIRVALPGFALDTRHLELTFLMEGHPVANATLRAAEK
jgi:hypothetical protein